jgi:hypothetical protein
VWAISSLGALLLTFAVRMSSFRFGRRKKSADIGKRNRIRLRAAERPQGIRALAARRTALHVDLILGGKRPATDVLR